MVTVTTLIETARGCGYRKPSKSGVGIYLIGPALSVGCGRLPFPLHVCPTCSAGIKPGRGWTWINPAPLFHLDSPWRNGAAKCDADPRICEQCPLGGRARAVLEPAPGVFDGGRHGLLWVGEGFYRSPHLFMAEAAKRGISRKLSALPKGFKLGETWVFLAHRKTVRVVDEPGQFGPGVFSIFKPTGVDLVIDDETNVPERAIKLAEDLGPAARIVKVVRDADTQGDLFEAAAT